MKDEARPFTDREKIASWDALIDADLALDACPIDGSWETRGKWLTLDDLLERARAARLAERKAAK